MMRKRRSVAAAGAAVIAAVAVLIGATVTLGSPDSALKWSVFGGGGNSASSTNYKLGSTSGQSSPIGVSQSTNYKLGAGFWTPGDSDGDGCPDIREQQTAAGTQTSGGRRDYTNFWDYAQMPTNAGLRDNKVRIADVSAVVLRYHQDEPNGSITRFSDPLSVPPPTGYHPAFDRSYVGPNSWNLGPPDGKIRINDVANVVQQFHHDCV